MIKFRFSVLFGLSLVLFSCSAPVPDKGNVDYKAAVSAFYVSLAAQQVGDDQRTAAELEKAKGLAPGEPAIWNNLGILQLRQKDLNNSASSLEKARSLAPENAIIHSNLAAMEVQRGNFQPAIEQYKKAIELAPGDIVSRYALGRENERAGSDAEALRNYEDILSARPENLAIKLEIARLAAKLKDTQKLKQLFDEFSPKLENAGGEIQEQLRSAKAAIDSGDSARVPVQVTYLRNVMLREPAFRSAVAELQPSETTIGKLITKPLQIPVPDFTPAEPDLNLQFETKTIDISSAIFAQPVFLNGDEPPVILRAGESELRIGNVTLPVSAAQPRQVAAFDFDYDFKNDLAVATENGFRLFRQTDGSNFEDATAKTKLIDDILKKAYTGVWTLDVESDGDLDLVLSDGAVLQNNSDGSFSMIRAFGNAGDIREFLSVDFDEDGDPDGVVLGSDGRIRIFSNERGGLYAEINSSIAPSVFAIAAGDANGDGQIDLIVLSNGLIEILAAKSGAKLEFQSVATINGDFCSEASVNDAGCSVDIADLDNNGANDILTSNRSAAQLLLGGKDAKFVPSAVSVSGNVTAIVDSNGDGKLDLVGIDAGGKPSIFQNNSTKNYHWQIVRPKAAKTEGDQRVNTFGIGGEIEIRSGLLAQKQLISSPQVHFGLGENSSADILRVVWGNGYVQAEFDLKADQTLAAEQRLKGSCPHLFAWNGSEFALVKDAPPWSPALGLKINAQDTYGILQTEEWFKIPGDALKPKDGYYELRITGEYWESFYLDSYQLIAVDHPSETEIFTDERFSIPLPPLKVFTTGKTEPFASAKNDSGVDVSGIVADLDENYLDGIKRGRFQGVATDHLVELELPANAPKDKKLWLVGDGWMHPTDASINVQRGQMPNTGPPKSLSLEVQDESGSWKTVKENLGFPAGKMKTILIELPQNSRRFRLRTELEIFWDKLAWAAAQPDELSTETRLDLSAAELRYRGFSVIEKRDDSSPEKPVYNKILTTGQRWRDLEGFYTRFGDVLELLKKTDDRMVLANAGDELILRFPELPAVKPGWKRDFVIVGNGWIKDGDLNSVFSKTLLPLPTHSTNDYSTAPKRLEDDPVYQKNKMDWLNFHTRYVSPEQFRNALR